MATSIRGFYGPSSKADGSFMVYLTEVTNLPIEAGWTVSDLPGITGNVFIQEYNSNVYSDVVVNPGPPAISFPYVSNAVVYADAPNAVNIPSSIVRLTLSPPTSNATANTANATTTFGLYDPRLFDGSKIQGDEAPLRELDSNVSTTEGTNSFTTVVDRGAGTGALTALAAIGAQEPYVFGGESHWIPKIIQTTPFQISYREIPDITVTGQMLGTSVQIPIRTRDAKDLISNMYLKCTLPALQSTYQYSELVGRAILKNVEIIIDGVSYELLTDDWYIIHDQMFLDADDKLRYYQMMNGGYTENQSVPASSPLNMLIPLNLFFCRSKRGYKRPYLPVCALMNSTIIIRITFNSASWITDAPTDANGNLIDISNVHLLLEEISLTPPERLYFMNKRHILKIPQIWKEAIQDFRFGQVRVNFTADFDIAAMFWFIRNKTFEQDRPPSVPATGGLSASPTNLAALRYNYGYTTRYISSTTPVTFFNGTTLNFIDVIQSTVLYINNNNIMSSFPGALYYSYKQPIDHGLSIPTKNIYMYNFSKNPLFTEGTLDFKTLNTNTSHLDMTFLPEYAPQLAELYNIHVYYYGYKTIEIYNGRVRYV
jgi:hypothetical protein